jgi:ATP-dependent exoDNAse (exonuclease V) beta subunit
LDGILDICYQDGTGWHIIDFKTDPIETPQRREELIQKYSKQVKGYHKAIGQLLHVEADARFCFLDDDGKNSLKEV